MNKEKTNKIMILALIFLVITIFHIVVFNRGFGSPDDNLAYIHFSESIIRNGDYQFYETFWQKTPPIYQISAQLFIFSAILEEISGISIFNIYLFLALLQYALLMILIYSTIKKSTTQNHQNKLSLLLPALIILIFGLFLNKNVISYPNTIFSKIALPYTTFFFLILILVAFLYFRENNFQIILLLAAYFMNGFRLGQFVLLFLIMLPFILKKERKTVRNIIYSLAIFCLTVIYIFITNDSLLEKILSDLRDFLYKEEIITAVFSKETPFLNIILSFPSWMLIMSAIGGLMYVKRVSLKGLWNKTLNKTWIFLFAASIILGWILVNPFSLKFKETFVIFFILCSPFLIYFCIKETDNKTVRLLFIFFVVTLLIIQTFGTLSYFKKADSDKWILSKSYINFINSAGSIVSEDRYLSDPTTNYIFSSLTSSEAAFYSRRSNPSKTCRDILAGNIESHNNNATVEDIKLFYNQKIPDFDNLKKENVNYIIYDKYYISECSINPIEFSLFIQKLEKEKFIESILCDSTKRVCLYRIN